MSAGCVIDGFYGFFYVFMNFLKYVLFLFQKVFCDGKIYIMLYMR